MTVLLLHVPVGFEEAYPLALATIAAPVIASGHRVEGLDVARAGPAGLRARLARGDVTLVGLSAWSPGLDAARHTIATVRSAAPKVPIVVGGPHPSLAPEDLDADVVVRGEAELAFAEIVATFARGERPPPVVGPPAPLDLATLPLPDRTIFRVRDYHRDHNPRGRLYTASVTSRGCLHACGYCSAPALWGRGHRYRPAEQVVEEWRRLRYDHGVDAVLVEDDLFSQLPSRVSELCDALGSARLGIGFELINGLRPETLSAGLLRELAAAGCTRIALSLETASEEALGALGRGSDLGRVSRIVAAARSAGLGVTGYFLLGLPGETAADRARTFAWAEGLGLDMAHFSVASAWPGTHFEGPLSPVTRQERARLYARWYIHPVRALRAAKMLGVTPRDLPRMAERLWTWMSKPLEARTGRDA